MNVIENLPFKLRVYLLQRSLSLNLNSLSCKIVFKYLKCIYDNLKLFKYYRSPMKPRNGKFNIMNPEFKSNELLKAVASVNDLYKLGESKMASRDNVEILFCKKLTCLIRLILCFALT